MRGANLEPFEGDHQPGRAWLREVFKPARRGFREAIVVSLFVNLLALAVPIFILQVYDRVVFHHGISTLYGLLIGVLIALVFDFLLRQARSRLLQRVALQIDISLGRSLYQRMSTLPLTTLESRPTGFWQTLFKDAELVRNTFSGATAVLLTDLPFAILFVGLIAIIAPPLVWVLLVALPVFVIVAIISGSVVDRATRQEREAGMSREAFLAEMLQGRATIKSLGIDEALRPDWEEKHANTIEQASIRGRRMDGFGNLGVLLSMLTTITLVTAGALAIIDLKLTIGALIASTMLGNRVIGPFNQLVNSWRSYTNVRQALRRLDSVFALPADRTETAVKLNRPDGRITFEKVSFGYSANLPPVIDNMTMDVKAPGMLGVVGRNGCGKTTLLKLMHGLYEPTEGRVLLDGADVKQFARRDMASNIGYVAQECFLFNGTIRDNIALTDPSATDEDIVRAATLAGVHEFAIDLPDGYDTAIGEAGSRLSGGQRQRVAIARALLPIPPVLLLDEVGANLDMQAEAALQKTLSDLAKDHSIVIVTHSPVLLQACTSIIALERGKIAIGGPASEVLARLFGDKKKAAPTGSTPQVTDRQTTPAASTAPAKTDVS